MRTVYVELYLSPVSLENSTLPSLTVLCLGNNFFLQHLLHNPLIISKMISLYIYNRNRNILSTLIPIIIICIIAKYSSSLTLLSFQIRWDQAHSGWCGHRLSIWWMISWADCPHWPNSQMSHPKPCTTLWGWHYLILAPKS
jgi:hypothetical protein